MAHSVVDPGSIPGTGPKLEVLQGGAVTFEAELVTAYSQGYPRNYSLMRAYGINEAVRVGDGHINQGSRTIEVLVEAVVDGETTLEGLVQDLDAALAEATHLRYDGTTLELAGSDGIAGVSYVSNLAAIITISYLPRYPQGVRGGTPVLGPL